MRVSRVREKFSLYGSMPEANLLVVGVLVILFVLELLKLGEFLQVPAKLKLVLKVVVERRLVGGDHNQFIHDLSPFSCLLLLRESENCLMKALLFFLDNALQF
jgi:hypothetical protein